MLSITSDQVDNELLEIFSSVSPPLLPEIQTPLNHSETIPDPSPKPVAGRRRKSPSTLDEIDENHSENRKKKILHRDVERQRRQEMASLFSSIRSLLPQEYLKGKRSVSDHMHETVNYIKYLQTKMKELGEKRDALKRLSTLSAINGMDQLQSWELDLVTVRESWAGVEIFVDTAIAEHGLSLSTLLQVLKEEDLHIVSCTSTIIKNRPLHTIETEVNGERRTDLCELQKRLTNLVVSYLT